MALDDLPETDRPRERLYFNGPTALADAELLALQLGSGMRGKDAVEVAREMLAAYGSLAGVAGREVSELARRPGVGRAKAARLAAAFELTRRPHAEPGGGPPDAPAGRMRKAPGPESARPRDHRTRSLHEPGRARYHLTRWRSGCGTSATWSSRCATSSAPRASTATCSGSRRSRAASSGGRWPSSRPAITTTTWR